MPANVLDEIAQEAQGKYDGANEKQCDPRIFTNNYIYIGFTFVSGFAGGEKAFDVKAVPLVPYRAHTPEDLVRLAAVRVGEGEVHAFVDGLTSIKGEPHALVVIHFHFVQLELHLRSGH